VINYLYTEESKPDGAPNREASGDVIMRIPLQFAATLALGLLAGALSLEGLVMVPYWRSLSAGPFSELHAGFAPRLYRFFAPLTGGAVALSVASSGAGVLSGGDVRTQSFSLVSVALAASLLAFYALYFHEANKRLPLCASEGNETRLRRELSRWHQVHMVRCVACLGAFACSLVGLL
jgi:hypothetical protein